MKVTAWKNGKHENKNTSYGLKITIKDRDSYFSKAWRSVFILLPGRKKEVELNIHKDSFWNDSCRELISHEVKEWLVGEGCVPWPSRQPPSFQLIQKNNNHFAIQ